jgi:16S rRNA (guanine(966)-N(2))-methyltransferase RsmD
MRIIAGTAGGRRLKAPRKYVRPTEDRVKGALFDILGDHVVGACVLDIFAGSGGLGLEALSRGAARAIFVDIDRSASDVIRENLRTLGFEDRAQVWKEGYVSAIRKLDADRQIFDLIFADPPYDRNMTVDVLSLLSSTAILAQHSIIATECSKRENLPGKMGPLFNIRERAYGDTRLAFWSLGSS